VINRPIRGLDFYTRVSSSMSQSPIIAELAVGNNPLIGVRARGIEFGSRHSQHIGDVWFGAIKLPAPINLLGMSIKDADV